LADDVDRHGLTAQETAMNHADEDKARNREIAENEAQRQTVSAIRVSTWAVAVAVVIGLAAVGWVLLHNH
jgi:F0F1-type ATP synthase assembly protein I